MLVQMARSLTGSGAATRSKVVRKAIARVLTVISQNQRLALRTAFKNKARVRSRLVRCPPVARTAAGGGPEAVPGAARSPLEQGALLLAHSTIGDRAGVVVCLAFVHP
jgi:hypothetical protein